MAPQGCHASTACGVHGLFPRKCRGSAARCQHLSSTACLRHELSSETASEGFSKGPSIIQKNIGPVLTQSVSRLSRHCVEKDMKMTSWSIKTATCNARYDGPAYRFVPQAWNTGCHNGTTTRGWVGVSRAQSAASLPCCIGLQERPWAESPLVKPSGALVLCTTLN